MSLVMTAKEVKRLVALEMGYRPQDVDVSFVIGDTCKEGPEPCFEMVQAVVTPKERNDVQAQDR